MKAYAIFQFVRQALVTIQTFHLQIMTAIALFTVQYIAYPEWLCKMHFMAQLLKQTEKESSVVLQIKHKTIYCYFTCLPVAQDCITRVSFVKNQSQK